jgi:hypothetical protein
MLFQSTALLPRRREGVEVEKDKRMSQKLGNGK